MPVVVTLVLVAIGAISDRSRRARESQAHHTTAAFVAARPTTSGGRCCRCGAPTSRTRARRWSPWWRRWAQRFAAIVDRLEQTLRATNDQGDRGLASVFEQSSAQLRGVLESLTAAMASNGSMHAEVQNLGHFVTELQQMAAEVADIAAQTNILAINAAIEAAHARAEGRGFMGSSRWEVRKLSAMSGEMGRRMAEKVALIGGAIGAARASAETSAKREAASAVASDGAINGVLSRFRQVTEAMEASTDVMKQESAGIQSEIVEALVQLQFQDRVSQRMTHVRHNIERLPVLMADSRDAVRPLGRARAWSTQKALARRRAREEQLRDGRRTRHPQATWPGRPSAAAAVGEAEEVTFF